MNPKYPIFIPTKGRADTRLTVKMFDELGVPYKIVIEEQEYAQYNAHVSADKILVVPHRDKGLTVTRNWIWDYAHDRGYERFWAFDDNIRAICRLNNNLKIDVTSGTALRCCEDFTERYENVIISGMHYDYFCKRKDVLPPFLPNTRVYSNMLIKTDARDSSGECYRNETFFNDDTDLCLRVLKDSYCTILFHAFLVRKIPTMIMGGGLRDHYDKTDNRKEFAEELIEKHPDVARLTRKFGRWHHHVDYSKFKGNRLIPKPGLVIRRSVNNYGMKLVNV